MILETFHSFSFRIWLYFIFRNNWKNFTFFWNKVINTLTKTWKTHLKLTDDHLTRIFSIIFYNLLISGSYFIFHSSMFTSDYFLFVNGKYMQTTIFVLIYLNDQYSYTCKPIPYELYFFIFSIFMKQIIVPEFFCSEIITCCLIRLFSKKNRFTFNFSEQEAKTFLALLN